GGRAGQGHAAPARGDPGGRRRRGRLPLLALRRVHHRPHAGGGWRPVGLMITLTPPWQDVPLAGGPLPQIDLPSNCPGCGVGLDLEELETHVYVCTCGHHFQLRADSWIALLADGDTWNERWSDVRPHDLLDWKMPKPYHLTIE